MTTLASPEHIPGEPLAADDPAVLAFRAVEGASEIAARDTVANRERALQNIVDLAPSARVAAEATVELLQPEAPLQLTPEQLLEKRRRNQAIDLLGRTHTVSDTDLAQLRAGEPVAAYIEDSLHRILKRLRPIRTR